jgi:hypothetical protein
MSFVSCVRDLCVDANVVCIYLITLMVPILFVLEKNKKQKHTIILSK